MKRIIFLLLLIPFFVSAQRYKEQINFNAHGDQVMALGRYQIGAAIRIEAQISGGWAQDGGIYHIVSDWGNVPCVTLRSESSISERLKFYGYVDPSTNGQAFLFATWDNQSTSESSDNNVQFTIYSEGTIDINNNGSFSSSTLLQEILSINATSKNVGVGISNPSEKLSVNGTIRSKEVKVEATPWPDYVFSEGYELKSLEETEAYIKANQRLPGMPSAEEVAEDGVALGEMNRLLLEKVEELTLHQIEMGKLIQVQQKEITELKYRLNKLTNEH